MNPEEKAALVGAALEARELAHAPFSGYRVGAAVRSTSGDVFTGCNVEVSNYSDGCCAERVAVFKAVSAGQKRLDTCVVVAGAEPPTGPCGACRQVLFDFGQDLLVILADIEGQVRVELPLVEIFPLAFGPEHLADYMDRDR